MLWMKPKRTLKYCTPSLLMPIVVKLLGTFVFTKHQTFISSNIAGTKRWNCHNILFRPNVSRNIFQQHKCTKQDIILCTMIACFRLGHILSQKA